MLYNIYFSPTGGTKKVADILAGKLGREVCEVDICCDIENMTLHAEDVCLVSVPSFAGRVPQVAVESSMRVRSPCMGGASVSRGRRGPFSAAGTIISQIWPTFLIQNQQ